MIYILLTVGCVENTKTVEVRNSVPTISIESHVDGDTVFVGDAIEFRALVTDNNNGPSELEVQWEVSGRVACPYTPPDSGGLSTCVMALNLGEEEVKATVRDPKNASDTDGVQLVLYNSEPPTAQILAPLSDGTYYADELILFEGIVEDEEDDPTQLEVRWKSSISGNLDLDVTPDSNGSFSNYVYLEAGDHALTLEVEDTSGKISSQDVVITVMETNPNTEPVVTSVNVLSTEIYTEDFFDVSVAASDPDGDNLTYTFEWLVNGVNVFTESTTLNNASLDGLIYFDKNDIIQADVSVSDGMAESSASSIEVVVLNTPPSAFNTQISPLEPMSGQDDLVCTTQYSNPDIDGDTVSLTYEWLVDDGSGSQTTTFTSDTVPGAETNTGEFWTCIVTPNDGTDDGEPDSAVVEIDGNAEGTQGYSFCAAGGSVSNSNYQMTFCLGPESLVVGEVSNGNYTMQMGPIYRYVPN